MTHPVEPPTSDELWRAYRAARLRYSGISFTKALMCPLLYKSLTIQALAERKKQQQHGIPAPVLQAA
jgi:hypothetical protein